MKKYLYFSFFIFIFFVFSGCYNEKSISSFDNKTEHSSSAGKNSQKESSEELSSSLNSAAENNSIDENNLQDTKSSADKMHIRENRFFSYKGRDKSHITDSSLIHKNLTGTYKIIFFGSQVIKTDYAVFGSIVDMYYISNDCKQAQKLYPDVVNKGIKNKCSSLTQSKMLDGAAVIFYDKNNYINIISRLQLEGGIIDNSPADKYQYTVYSPIEDKKILQGSGVTNWNYDTVKKGPAAAKSFKSSPFKLTIINDNLIRIDMTLKNKNIKAVGKNLLIDAKNTILLEKISSEYTKLENRVQKKFSR